MEKFYERIYTERNHIEGILNSRFNFFMGIFAALIAIVLNIETLLQLRTVLTVSVVVMLPIALTIVRAQLKLDIYLKKLSRNNEFPTRYGDLVARRAHWPIRASQRGMIGYWIPVVLMIVILTSIIFAEPLFENVIFRKSAPEVFLDLNNRLGISERQLTTVQDLLKNERKAEEQLSKQLDMAVHRIDSLERTLIDLSKTIKSKHGNSERNPH